MTACFNEYLHAKWVKMTTDILHRHMVFLQYVFGSALLNLNSVKIPIHTHHNKVVLLQYVFTFFKKLNWMKMPIQMYLAFLLYVSGNVYLTLKSGKMLIHTQRKNMLSSTVYLHMTFKLLNT